MICRNRPRSTSTCSATILAMASRNGRSEALIVLRGLKLDLRSSIFYLAELRLLLSSVASRRLFWHRHS